MVACLVWLAEAADGEALRPGQRCRWDQRPYRPAGPRRCLGVEVRMVAAQIRQTSAVHNLDRAAIR